MNTKETPKKQTKSRQRVRDHGEVFTNEREVKAMCDLVKDETERIDSRFLEPACGDGNFLAEILTRKLEIVKRKYKKSALDYEKNAVLAASSIYGVDILIDMALPEELRQKPITQVRTVDIDAVMKDVKPRKYEELRTLFNGIFKYAVASGIIQHNPVALIKFKRAERQTRDALPKDEIIAFLERIKQPKYDEIRQAMYLLYFFGLRPCEVDSDAHKEGSFLIARNRKRKNGKIEYKKIPICRQAREQLNLDEPIVFPHRTDVLNRIFKRIMNDEEITQY